MKERKLRDPLKYKIRTCTYGEECEFCHTRILVGNQYRDGGYGRRSHLTCAATRHYDIANQLRQRKQSKVKP